jgi:hypothetical protein
MGIRTILSIALILAGIGTAGCSRSSDGTILYANPVNRMLGTEEPMSRPDPAAAATFPEPPPPVRTAPPARRAPLRLWDVRPVQPPFVSARTAASLLSCRNETAPGGRVRVVCR